MPRIAVLCGTGMSAFASALSSSGMSMEDSISIESPWGAVPISLVQGENGEVVIIDRHFSNSESRTPPHAINHRANIHAVISTNPDLVVSVNSVGSIRPDLPPGTVAVAGDVLDLAVRPWTFHDDEATHADRTSIFDHHASGVCKNAISSVQKNAPDGLVVAQCIGPQFESPAEINALERLGAHVVGMTLGPESRLLSETSIPYAGLPCCSNWAAGRTPGMPNEKISHHDVDEIASGMRETVALCINALLSDMG